MTPATLDRPRPATVAIDTTATAIIAPERSLTQRMDALNHANAIRMQRAQLKRDLKARRTTLSMQLLDPPDYLANAKIYELILALPKFGRVKANKVIAHCRISPSKTIGGLSPRQRNELAAALQGR